MTELVLATPREVIAHHSKSFSLASKLLPEAARDDAAMLYAWCRRVDDIVDVETPDRERLLAELHAPDLRELMARRRIPAV